MGALLVGRCPGFYTELLCNGFNPRGLEILSRNLGRFLTVLKIFQTNKREQIVVIHLKIQKGHSGDLAPCYKVTVGPSYNVLLRS